MASGLTDHRPVTADARGLARSLDVLLAFVFYLQIVGNAKDAWHTFSLNLCYLFVHLPGDNTFQGYVAIVHDDVDWRYGPQSVLAEDIVPVNGAIDCASDTIVIGRRWQHFDLIVHALYALDSLHHVFSISNDTRSPYGG